MPELTEADLADYRITWHQTGKAPTTIRAAYIAGDKDQGPLIAFKDHEHRTVALVSRDAVLLIERQDDGDAQSERKGSGFRPTSEIMDRK
jgi:hypothetical protein